MSIGRTAAAVAAVALSVLVATPAAAQPATTSTAEAGAGWLARRLVDGERFEVDYGGKLYPDHGGTIDAVLAFAAAGVAEDNALKATAWLAEPEVLPGYIGDPKDSAYAGSYAKLALTAQVRGEDPTAFGGVDLITGLNSLLTASGRFSDKSPYPGDYSNGFSQSFAVLALERHGTAPKAAVDYLAATACPTGGYPLDLEQATCVAQVDATAMAAQALLAAGRTAEAGKAVEWLVAQQQADGGFVDVLQKGDAGTTTNANTTGLAAQALRVAGATAAADKAVAYLKALQVGCGAEQAGAIAYDAKGFSPANATRATAQAVLGLVGTGFATLSSSDAKATAPVLDCPATTTTTTVATTTTSETPAAGPQAQQPEVLARTGVPVAPALWLGTLLVVAGALALVLGRRRYAPARQSSSVRR
ncbi:MULTISPECIES: peptidase [unclassified Saccharothrix]|uniref:peptidase n=1 Tax=unclassified Saccharothrix TaxID=2593673 RepID=UPI00307FCD40